MPWLESPIYPGSLLLPRFLLSVFGELLTQPELPVLLRFLTLPIPCKLQGFFVLLVSPDMLDYLCSLDMQLFADLLLRQFVSEMGPLPRGKKGVTTKTIDQDERASTEPDRSTFNQPLERLQRIVSEQLHAVCQHCARARVRGDASEAACAALESYAQVPIKKTAIKTLHGGGKMRVTEILRPGWETRLLALFSTVLSPYIRALDNYAQEAFQGIVSEALYTARESPNGAVDPRTQAILWAGLYQVWTKLLAEPDGYTMTPDEFSLFNYFQHLKIDPIIARHAIKRYWDNHIVPEGESDGSDSGYSSGGSSCSET